MKIKKIEVQNFKAISNKSIELNGCSAIVTAANDSGKTSLLRGLIDRFRSEKPEIIVKEGEEKGFNRIELTDGNIIEWKFTEKTESFALITKEGFKQTTGVISAIGERYFGQKFDIDSFLNSSPKQQVKELQKICGLDFEEIDERYKEAYDERTEANRELKRIASQKVEQPEPVKEPDIDFIKKELAEVREANSKAIESERKRQRLADQLDSINRDISQDFSDCFDWDKAKKKVDSVKVPERIDESEIESRLEQAQEQLRKFDAFEREQQAYEQWVKDGKKAREESDKADGKVKAIEAEKKEMVAKADMPEGFDITEDGINYNGFPLTDNQISSSGKYIAALKLGSMVLGELQTLHFDASTLDNNSLSKVQEWANEKGLQLLIERPDFDGGDIKYEIIDNSK
jgi:recombinational DNA repair ATPase RecF